MKPPAASRTVDMFAPVVLDAERAPEVIEEEVKGERLPLEEDHERLRDNAFKGQEWTTKFFGKPDAPGNEYRLTRRGEYYYLETLSKASTGHTVHGYSGLMVHERDLFSITNLLVLAARAKKTRDTVPTYDRKQKE